MIVLGDSRTMVIIRKQALGLGQAGDLCRFTCNNCCDMGQNDTIGKIELFPLSSCQVIILIARMTFNSSLSCLMS